MQLIQPNQDTVQLQNLFDNKDTMVVILAHGYSCADCYNELNQYVDRFRINPIVIIRDVDSPLSKRLVYKDLGRRLNKVEEFYFDLHEEIDPFPPDQITEGVFAIKKVKITPAILILTKDGFSKLIPYEKLFKGSKGEINLETISELLN